jgi:hypothetical protein
MVGGGLKTKGRKERRMKNVLVPPTIPEASVGPANY